MDIYVVTYEPYRENLIVLGVFSTYERADRAISDFISMISFKKFERNKNLWIDQYNRDKIMRSTYKINELDLIVEI